MKKSKISTAAIAICAAAGAYVTVPTVIPEKAPLAAAQRADRITLDRMGSFEAGWLNYSELRTEVKYYDRRAASPTLKVQGIATVYVGGSSIQFEPTGPERVDRNGDDFTVTREMNDNVRGFTVTQIYEIKKVNDKALDHSVRYQLRDHRPEQNRSLRITYQGFLDSGSETTVKKNEDGSVSVSRTAEADEGNYFDMSFGHFEDVRIAAVFGSGRFGQVVNNPVSQDPQNNGIHIDAENAVSNNVFGSWQGSGELTSEVNFRFHSNQAAYDTDGDGLPDRLEERLAAKYGTDPQNPDLFLQLNWMPSVRDENSQCFDEGGRRVSAQDTINYLECARLSDRSFAPTADSINQIINLFADKGITLHVDAGPELSNIKGAGYEYQGGERGEYKRNFFGDNFLESRNPAQQEE